MCVRGLLLSSKRRSKSVARQDPDCEDTPVRLATEGVEGRSLVVTTARDDDDTDTKGGSP